MAGNLSVSNPGNNNSAPRSFISLTTHFLSAILKKIEDRKKVPNCFLSFYEIVTKLGAVEHMHTRTHTRSCETTVVTFYGWETHTQQFNEIAPNCTTGKRMSLDSNSSLPDSKAHIFLLYQ